MNMNGLTPKQEKAIAALISEPTILLAAEKTGTSEATMHRWLREESFNKAYKESRRALISQTITILQQTTNEAVRTLRSVMTDENAPASSRVTAASKLLEMTFKGYEIYDMADRFDEIEQRLKDVEVNA
jgi:arginine/lysine/ornithine decarboxylase